MKLLLRFRLRSLQAVAVYSLLIVAVQVLRAQETKEKVTVDDVERTYTLRLPSGYDAQRRYPVVILLHGMNQDADDMERLTQFDALADKDGIVAVYPFALHGRWNTGVHPQERRPMAWGPVAGAIAAATAAVTPEGVVIPEEVAATRAAANPEADSQTRSEGRLRRTTSRSSIRCWTSSKPNCRLIPRASTSEGFPKADS